MIYVSVRDDDGVEFVRGERRILPVALAKFAATLKEAAIDQDAPAAGFEQVF